MAAVICVALTNVVGRGEPFQFTTRPCAKPVPFTVSVSPAELQYGVLFIPVVDAESEVTVGSTIAKDSALEVPPPQFVPGGGHWPAGIGGFSTVICAVPTEVMSAAGTAAINCGGVERLALT